MSYYRSTAHSNTKEEIENWGRGEGEKDFQTSDFFLYFGHWLIYKPSTDIYTHIHAHTHKIKRNKQRERWGEREITRE